MVESVLTTDRMNIQTQLQKIQQQKVSERLADLRLSALGVRGQKGLNVSLNTMLTTAAAPAVFQAAPVCRAGPPEAAGRHRVLQQIRRVPALQSQTQLHLLLPAAYAGRQKEVPDEPFLSLISATALLLFHQCHVSVSKKAFIV